MKEDLRRATFAPRRARALALGPSAVVFLAALPTPALLFAENDPVKGIETLLFGWWGLIKGDFPWFANPLYFAALCLAWNGMLKSALVPCALAIVLGLRSTAVREWYFNEAGGTPIAGLGLAFYLWIASFVLLLAGALFLEWRRRQLAVTGAA